MSKFLHLTCISLLTLLFQILCFTGTAQQPYYNQRPDYLNGNSIWAFGDSAGLDFNSGTAVAITTGMDASVEGCATVSDRSTGELLFYSDGGSVWNADGMVMPNGDSLLGNRCIQQFIRPADTIVWFDSAIGSTDTLITPADTTTLDDLRTSSQGVLIVPVIGDPDKYYLFSLVGTTCDGVLPQAKLYYNVVDMSLDGDRGDIVSGQKNIALSAEVLSEAMIAIPGNCNDIWLLMHREALHQYYAWHITSEGIDTVPVISNPNYTGAIPLYGGPTYMNVSPDRSMLAIGGFFDFAFFLGRFDPATGQVSNIIAQEFISPRLASFSPDNSKVYISNNNTDLNQYDVSIYDSAAIANSIQSIYSLSRSRYRRGMLKLYNDTIYQVVNTTASSSPAASIATLGYISKPNLSGVACDFQEGTVQAISPSLFAGNGCVMSSEVVYPMWDSIFPNALDTAVCGELVLHAAAGSDYLWEDGSVLPNRTIFESGTFWVVYKDECANTIIDTYIVSMTLLDPVIRVDEFALSTTSPYASYQWLLNGGPISGATDSVYTVLENGDYQVIVSNGSGCTDTSAIYPVNNVGIYGVHPQNDAVSIYPNPADEYVYIEAPMDVQVGVYSVDGRCMKPVEQANRIDITKLPNGLYFLKIYDLSGRLVKIEKLIK